MREIRIVVDDHTHHLLQDRVLLRLPPALGVTMAHAASHAASGRSAAITGGLRTLVEDIVHEWAIHHDT